MFAKDETGKSRASGLHQVNTDGDGDVVFIGCYKYDGKTMLVSEYAQVSLRQTIAIPYDFEKTHVSKVCS
ncbi:hypothetical protein VE01_06686 [Pseudogymnoascus verrucosus]|uniref:Uncharacterized protein n=1 Tax=Pseudogymnoascus verrucosus TaxID=342668 RepID=A0A1B8GJG7_9PEZI|nr:uncharacterized protein VE01_06686 [Pseudogymnoascus verrucosus]OBT95965.1 hypothetical protein VE01_06686 [Pseudogymnoascus verrucosus]